MIVVYLLDQLIADENDDLQRRTAVREYSSSLLRLLTSKGFKPTNLDDGKWICKADRKVFDTSVCLYESSKGCKVVYREYQEDVMKWERNRYKDLFSVLTNIKKETAIEDHNNHHFDVPWTVKRIKSYLSNAKKIKANIDTCMILKVYCEDSAKPLNYIDRQDLFDEYNQVVKDAKAKLVVLGEPLDEEEEQEEQEEQMMDQGTSSSGSSASEGKRKVVRKPSSSKRAKQKTNGNNTPAEQEQNLLAQAKVEHVIRAFVQFGGQTRSQVELPTPESFAQAGKDLQELGDLMRKIDEVIVEMTDIENGIKEQFEEWSQAYFQ